MFEYSGVKTRTCPGVYEPSEDTFLLAEHIEVNQGDCVLDMGTGSGLLGLMAASMGGEVLAADISADACRCARENARLNGFSNFKVRQSDLFSGIHESFDLVIFNPPYLPVEGWEVKDNVSTAWDGGADGRWVLDRFLEGFETHLSEGGRLLMLGSSLSGYPKTMDLLGTRGFRVSLAATLNVGFEELAVIKACL